MRAYSGTDFTDEQLRDYCAGIYPGGSISVPSAIVNALYLLSQNPHQLANLLDAIDDLNREHITYESLTSCLPLEQVMREALRLAPPVPFFTRNVLPDRSVNLGGYDIPAGTQLFINNWAIHRNPAYWANPEQFLPERWDRATIEAKPFGSKYFFPFGRGKRACIGQNFCRVFHQINAGGAAVQARGPVWRPALRTDLSIRRSSPQQAESNFQIPPIYKDSQLCPRAAATEWGRSFRTARRSHSATPVMLLTSWASS